MKKPRLRRDKTEVIKPKSFISRELNPSRERGGNESEGRTKSGKFEGKRPKVTQVGNLLIKDFDFTRGAIGRIPRKDEVTGLSLAKDRDYIFPWKSPSEVYLKKGHYAYCLGCTGCIKNIITGAAQERKEKHGRKTPKVVCIRGILIEDCELLRSLLKFLFKSEVHITKELFNGVGLTKSILEDTEEMRERETVESFLCEFSKEKKEKNESAIRA